MRYFLNPQYNSEKLLSFASKTIETTGQHLKDIGVMAQYVVGKDILPNDIHYATTRYAEYATSTNLMDKGKLLALTGWFVVKMVSDHEDLQPYLKAIGNIGKDPLTHLADRGIFFNQLEEEIQNESNSALLMIDIMNFKNINNTKGQVVGDLVLQEFSKALQQNFRTQRMTDSIHTGSLESESSPSRLGGDEFAVILSDGENLNFNSIETLCQNKAINLLSSQEVLGIMKKIGLKEFGLRIGGAMIGDDPIKTMDQADHKTKTKVTAIIKRSNQGVYTIYILQKKNSINLSTSAKNNNSLTMNSNSRSSYSFNPVACSL